MSLFGQKDQNVFFSILLTVSIYFHVLPIPGSSETLLSTEESGGWHLPLPPALGRVLSGGAGMPVFLPDTGGAGWTDEGLNRKPTGTLSAVAHPSRALTK